MNLTKEEQEKHSRKIKSGLLKITFYILTAEEKERIKLVLKLKSPKLQRVKESKNQMSLQTEINWHKLTCHTSIDEKKGGLTKSGRIWFHITSPKLGIGEKRVFTISLFRTGDFSKKAVLVGKFLVDALRNRPIDSNKTYMELKEGPIGTYHWVSVTRRSEKILLTDNSTSRITKKELEEIKELFAQKAYYEGVVRPRKKIKKRSRRNRNQHKPGTPNKAVPRTKAILKKKNK